MAHGPDKPTGRANGLKHHPVWVRIPLGALIQTIIGLCTWALDQLGIAWRLPKHNTVSVARREAVAALDEFIGPKH